MLGITETEYLNFSEPNGEFLVDEHETVYVGGATYMYAIFADGTYWHFPPLPLAEVGPFIYGIIGIV